MPDKLRKTQPVKITFSTGEQPTAQKLTALAEQSRNGSDLLESAIGDLWNSSGDIWLSDYPLQVPNLARLLGSNAYLNPAIYPGRQDFQFRETIGDRWSRKTEGYLLFKPKASSAFDVTGMANWTTEVANERDVVSPGDFWIDDNTGRFVSYGYVDGPDKIIYTVSPDSDWIHGQEVLPGVIPDPGQSQFTGCKLEFSGGKWLLYLPPRRPLTLGAKETPPNYPSVTEQIDTENIANSDGAPFKFWQNGTTAITGITAIHYRYALPGEIADTWATQDPGTRLPDGYIYLWDQTSQTIIENVVFKKPSDPAQEEYTIECDFTTSAFDPTTVESTLGDHSDSAYNTGLTLIVCGSPIARNIWKLTNTLLLHKHNNSSQESLIPHNAIINKDPPTYNYTTFGHDTRYPTYLPAWAPSNWEQDPHMSLLSRAGAQAAGRERDLYNNAMLGHLVLANQDPTTGIGARDYLNKLTPDESFQIRFGDIDGPAIFADSGSSIIMDATTVGGVNNHIILNANGDVQLLGAGGEIYASASTNFRVVSDNFLTFAPGATSTFVANNDRGLRIRSGQGNGNWALLQFDGDQGNPIGQIGVFQEASGSSIAFGISTTFGSGITKEAMRIKYDGTVGIGTTNPDQLLHITSTGAPRIRLERDDTTIIGTDNIGILEFEHQDTDNPGIAAQIIAKGDGTAGEGRLIFSTGTPGSLQEAFFIRASGKIGVGVANPAPSGDPYSLHIKDNLLLGEGGVDDAYIVCDGNLAVMAEGEVRIVSDSNDAAGAVGSDIVLGGGSASTTYGDTLTNYGTLPRLEWGRFDASDSGILKLTGGVQTDNYKYNSQTTQYMTYHTNLLRNVNSIFDQASVYNLNTSITAEDMVNIPLIGLKPGDVLLEIDIYERVRSEWSGGDLECWIGSALYGSNGHNVGPIISNRAYTLFTVTQNQTHTYVLNGTTGYTVQDGEAWYMQLVNDCDPNNDLYPWVIYSIRLKYKNSTANGGAVSKVQIW